MISPRLTSVYGRMCLETGPEGEKASLSTSRWSPISSVSSMDPVGMTKACTSVVVPKSSRIIVTVHSAMKPRGWSPVAGGGAGTSFTSATVAAFFCSTDTYCSESLIFCGAGWYPARRLPIGADCGYPLPNHDTNVQRRRHRCCANPGKTRPPPAGGTGVLLHHSGRGRADLNEDRRQPPGPARLVGHGHQSAADGRLLPLRPLHAAAGAGPQRRRVVAALPRDSAHLRVGDGALVSDLSRRHQPLEVGRYRAHRVGRDRAGQRRPALKTPVSHMLLVLLGAFIGSFGGVFLKSGAAQVREGLVYLFISRDPPFFNWRLATGIAFFLVSSYFFVLGIRPPGELSVLYPMVSLGYIFTLLWSRIFFKEPLTRVKFFGLFLIVAGVVFVGLGSK